MKSKCKVLKPPEDGAPAGLLEFYEWAAEKKIDCKTTCGGDEDRLARAGKGEREEKGEEEGKLGGQHGGRYGGR